MRICARSELGGTGLWSTRDAKELRPPEKVRAQFLFGHILLLKMPKSTQLKVSLF